MPVDTPSAAYEDMKPRVAICRDCFRGSDVIKGAGDTYLPMLASHTKGTVGFDAYGKYKARALFFNAFARTVHGLNGLVFQKEVTIDVPSHVKDHVTDITLAGEDLEQFAADTMRESLITGGYGIMIDVPADAGVGKDRPYWSRYQREDIVSVRRTRVQGVQVLTRVVLRELVTDPDPEAADEETVVEQYRVLALTVSAEEDASGPTYTQQLWRKRKGAAEFTPYGPQIIPRRGTTPLDFIPFVLPDVVMPPLLDLAYINISHYVSSADYKHGLHMVALPTPYVADMTHKPKDGAPIPFGPGVVWALNSGGSAGMCEFSGAGMSAIRDDMLDMIKMMATVGARLLEEAPQVAETASAVSMRHSGEHATLRTAVQFVEADLERALAMHAWWAGTGELEAARASVTVELNKEFFTIRMDPQMLQQLVMAVQAGAMSGLTFWYNLELGGVARPGVTWEQEEQEIGNEGTELGAQMREAGDAK